LTQRSKRSLRCLQVEVP